MFIDIDKITKMVGKVISLLSTEPISIDFFEDEYSDKFFRWHKGDFNSKAELICLIRNDGKLYLFSVKQIRERLATNKDKVKSKDNNFACHFGLVEDLIVTLDYQQITDEEISEFKAMDKELKEFAKKKELEEKEAAERKKRIEKQRRGYAKIKK